MADGEHIDWPFDPECPEKGGVLSRKEYVALYTTLNALEKYVDNAPPWVLPDLKKRLGRSANRIAGGTPGIVVWPK